MRTAVFFTQQKIRHLRLIKVNNLRIYFSDISGGLTTSPIFVMRILLVSICSCFKMATPLKSNMASWKITMFNRRYVDSFMVVFSLPCYFSRGVSH